MFKKILKIVVVLAILALIAYIYYSVIEDIVQLQKLNEHGSAEAIKEYLRSFGFKGAMTIVAMVMLQMVVIILPAEFVQISAGLAYPIYYALPICMLGVACGATLIFILVRVLNLRMEEFEKGSKRINKVIRTVNRNTSMTMLMYLLFVMPAIPYGAICYFASSSKISYGRYILVCATGVIPSIATSYIMGNVLYHQIGKPAIQTVIVMVIVILLAIILLGIFSYIIKRVLLKDTTQKPNMLLYYPIYWAMSLYFHLKLKIVNNAKELRKIKGPAVILSTHPSFYDFVFVAMATIPKRIDVVVNRYYTRIKPLRRLLKHFRVIPKKLFSPDANAVKQIMSAIRHEHIVVMMPEGRLSSSGTNFPITNGTAELIKKLGVDVYYVNTLGAYYVKPKWAPSLRRTKVEITGGKLIGKEELANISLEELDSLISTKLSYTSTTLDKVKCKDRTLGLDGLLYVCPHCHSEFTLNAGNNKVVCNNCDYEVSMDEYCSFTTGDYPTIAHWYDYQQSLIANSLDDIHLAMPVEVHKIARHTKKMAVCGRGDMTLDKDNITFDGTIDGRPISFAIPLSRINALPYDTGKHIDLYYNNELYYMYPQVNPNQCAKWAMVVDEVTKRRRTNNAQILKLHN